MKSFLISNLFYINNIFLDPLEQFETAHSYDILYNSSLFIFILAAFSYLITEKSLNFFLSDDFIDNLLLDLIISNLPKDLYYVYYILYPIFLLIFSSNMSGLFAFGFTETASVPLVFLFSFTIFFGILLTGIDRKRNFILNSFLPAGTPASILKLLIVIEIISYSTRLISLALRLLANMISGHILLKILISFVWILFFSSTFFSYLFFIPWVLVLSVLGLEILIAFLQSYVFVFLSIVFIKEIV